MKELLISRTYIKYPEVVNQMKKKRITRKELAKILKLSYLNMGRKISGVTPWKIDEIDILCKIFEKSYEELFKRKG